MYSFYEERSCTTQTSESDDGESYLRVCRLAIVASYNIMWLLNCYSERPLPLVRTHRQTNTSVASLAGGRLGKTDEVEWTGEAEVLLTQ